jgi:excisionase family DNA binding protein
MQNGQTPRSRHWFTAKEAADYIGVHPDTLYRYTRQRKDKPPFRRFRNSGPYRFPREEFIQWANGSKQG